MSNNLDRVLCKGFLLKGSITVLSVCVCVIRSCIGA